MCSATSSVRNTRSRVALATATGWSIVVTLPVAALMILSPGCSSSTSSRSEAQTGCESIPSCRSAVESEQEQGAPKPDQAFIASALAVACSLGDGPACVEAAGMYAAGARGLERNAEIAASLLGDGCNLHRHGESCHELAGMYAAGRGVAQDRELAERLYAFACEFGDCREAERQRAEAERQRAEAERQRAEAEREQERQRALAEREQERQRALAEAPQRAAAERASNTSTCPSGYSYIPSGVFEMGSPSTEAGRGSDETQHVVTLTGGFCLQTTEVTQSQWSSVMGSNPSYFDECGGTCPVEMVSWLGAARYLNALSRREGLRECYDSEGRGTVVNGMSPFDSSGRVVRGRSPYWCEGYRFPTEAEWEWAARAGTTGSRYDSLSLVAWYESNSDDRTHPVGRLEANAWGLYDMLGNVSEWTHDWADDYVTGDATDPSGPRTGGGRVYRGGSYLSAAQSVRAANRGQLGSAPSNGIRSRGFRPARSAR